VGDVRGLGLIVAVELVKDRETKEQLVHPDPEAPVEERPIVMISDGCLRDGLLIMPAMSGSTVRMSPPLIITEEDADEATEILEKQITTVEKKFL
jgi:4-aminobutyrate aminotransferase-like enzyme